MEAINPTSAKPYPGDIVLCFNPYGTRVFKKSSQSLGDIGSAPFVIILTFDKSHSASLSFLVNPRKCFKPKFGEQSIVDLCSCAISNHKAGRRTNKFVSINV